MYNGNGSFKDFQGNGYSIKDGGLNIPSLEALANNQKALKEVLSVLNVLLWTEDKREDMRKKMKAVWTPEMRAAARAAMQNVYHPDGK